MTSMQSDAGYADRVLQAAMVAATGGLDADRVAEVVTKVVEAIDKQAAALKRRPTSRRTTNGSPGRWRMR